MNPYSWTGFGSQVLPQVVDLIQDKVQVLPADLRTDDHHPEKVGLVTVGLVANHHAALLHHALFHHWGHLWKERGETWMTFCFQKHYCCTNRGTEGCSLVKYCLISIGKTTQFTDELLTVCSFFQSSGPRGRLLRLGGMYQKQTFVYSGCRQKSSVHNKCINNATRHPNDFPDGIWTS